MWLEEGWKWRGQGTFVSCGVLSVCKAALKALSFTTCLHVHLPCESTLFTLPVSLHCTEVVFRSCFLQEAHEHSYDWDDQGSKCTKPHTGFVNMHEKAPGHARFQGARWQAHKKKLGWEENMPGGCLPPLARAGTLEHRDGQREVIPHHTPSDLSTLSL